MCILWIFRNVNIQNHFQQILTYLSLMPQCHSYNSLIVEENMLSLSEQGMGCPFLSKPWQSLPSKGEMKQPGIISIKQTEPGREYHYQEYNCPHLVRCCAFALYLHSACSSLQVLDLIGDGEWEDSTWSKGQNWNSGPPVCVVRLQVGKSWHTQTGWLRGVFFFF